MHNRTHFIKNFIASILGVAGISAVIAFPTIGQANSNPNNSHNSSRYMLAQNTPGKASPAPGSTNRTGNQANVDQKFVTQAGESDLFEIQTSQLALQRAKSPEVKKYAQQMIDEHKNSSKQLSSIAQQKGYKLPTTIGQANASLVTQLTKAADANFDNTYMQLQVTAHTKTLDNYRNYINNASDSQLKAFATKTASVVDKHLKMAQSMVGNSSDSGSSSDTSPRGTIPGSNRPTNRETIPGSNRPTTNTPGTGTVRPSPDTGR